MASFSALKTELINYFKSPYEIEKWDEDFGTKLSFWLKILAIDFIISAIITIIMSIIEGLGIFSMENHAVLEMMESLSPVVFIILAVFMIPFIEELVFRLPLRNRFNPLFRLITLFSRIFGKQVHQDMKEAFESIYAKYFKIIFYSSALIFALLHITNYDMSFTLLLFMPLLILPQLLFGMFGGYIRLKLGFFWGACLHFAHNLIFLSIPLIMMMNSDEYKFNNDAVDAIFLSTENVSIQIEESDFSFFSSKHAQFSDDSLSFKDYGLNEIILMLLDVREELVKFENVPYSKGLRLECNAKVLNDSVDINKALLEQLEKHYHFRISQQTSLEKGLEIFIADTAKFTQNTKAPSNETYNTHISSSFGSMEMTNVSLGDLAETLSKNMNQPVSYTGSSKHRIDISYDTGSTDEIKKVLFDKLGLKFKDIKQEQSYYLVEGVE